MVQKTLKEEKRDRYRNKGQSMREAIALARRFAKR